MAAVLGQAVRQMTSTKAGVVISAGKMQKTVTVRLAKEHWNRKLRKNYTVFYKLLVNDPTSAVLSGDVVTLAPERHSKHVRYTVLDIISPFSKPLAERPALLTPEQRMDIYQEKRARKLERKTERTQLVKEGVVQEGDVVDDGSVQITGIAGAGKGKVLEHGREVLPGGVHRFGKINQEARRGKLRTQELVDKRKSNEAELERVEEENTKEADNAKR